MRTKVVKTKLLNHRGSLRMRVWRQHTSRYRKRTEMQQTSPHIQHGVIKDPDRYPEVQDQLHQDSESLEI